MQVLIMLATTVVCFVHDLDFDFENIYIWFDNHILFCLMQCIIYTCKQLCVLLCGCALEEEEIGFLCHCQSQKS